MAKKRQEKRDPLVSSIAGALQPGQFIGYYDDLDFIDGLESVSKVLGSLVRKGEAARACDLYELFLAGCYDKIEEVDDSSGSFGAFFEELFCDWIRARQRAGHAAAETVRLALKWIANDAYGFLYGAESNLAAALNAEGFKILYRHYEDRLEKLVAEDPEPRPERYTDFSWDVRRAAEDLKKLLISKKKTKELIALCERMGVTPNDCKVVAELLTAKKSYAKALEWVDRGASLEDGRSWEREAVGGFELQRQELLHCLGRNDEALNSAWAQFNQYPCDFYYDMLMKYVPKSDRKTWHIKAMERAKNGSLKDFIDICVNTKEWDALAERVESEPVEEFLAMSHHTLKPAAEGLARKHAAAAARVYCAMALWIVNAGKSKCYHIAIEHFRKARECYFKSNMAAEWAGVVETVRLRHSRKYSFIGDFEEIALGETPAVLESFTERARRKWQEQIR